MATNVVTAAFGASKIVRTRALYQWDYGQVLRFLGIDLPDAYTVHFSNVGVGGTAKTMVGNADGVDIPDEYLTTGKTVYAWVYLHAGEDDGETVYAVIIPVTQRPQPTEEEPTPQQQGLIDQAIAALNAGVEAAEDAAESVQDMGVEAETLAPGSDATVEKTVDPETGVVTLEFGIPRGAKGVPGSPGQDGVSPTATATQTSTGATISITDAKGTTTAYITNGQDGISPTITVTDITGGHRVTIMDETGPHSFDVMDGTDGEDGRGIASAVLNADYTLTLTYTDGTSYTTPSIRGPKGDTGEVSEAELTAKLMDKADVIVDTTSGAIVSFPDGMAAPAKDITIDIDPVQDLHGQESPYPAGGGKNQAYTSLEGGSVGVTGGIGINQSYDMAIAKVESGVTYTVTTDDSQLVCAFYETEPYIGITTSYDSTRTVQASKTFTAPITGWIAFRVQSGFATYQCEKGTTATTYAPYSNICPISGWTGANVVVSPTTDAQDGTTYPISWQSEAGTVYGGTLDVTTGVLTVDRAEVDLGTLNWGMADGNVFYNSSIANKKRKSQGVICSNYANPYNFNASLDRMADKTVQNRTDTDVIYIKDSAYSDPAAFKAAMSGVQLVYELATPQTYQLTPTEVALLLGENNVWADTGDSTVTYRADTKLYIQKINAPTDDDMVADAQIASGKYFIIGGNLYRSTTTIPAGDTITPGTNCILTNLAEALNALNT